MQVKDLPQKDLFLVHQHCLKETEEFKNRTGYNPRGIYKPESPCYCGLCQKHFIESEMTFWLFRNKPDQNE